MNSAQTNQSLNYKTYIKRARLAYQKPVAKTSTALLLTLATIGFFGIFAIRPTLATVSELIKEIEQKQEVDKKLTQKIAALTTAQEEYNAIRDKLPVLNLAIPKDQEKNLILLQLEYLAWSKGASIDNLRVNAIPIISAETLASDTTDTFPSFVFNATFSSPNEEVLFLILNDITNLDRIFRLESVSFSQEERDNDLSSYIMNTSIRAYYAPDKQAPTKAGESVDDITEPDI